MENSGRFSDFLDLAESEAMVEEQEQQQQQQQQQQDETTEEESEEPQEAEGQERVAQGQRPRRLSSCSNLLAEIGLEMLVAAVSKCIHDEMDVLRRIVKQDKEDISGQLSTLLEVVNRPRSPRRRQRSAKPDEISKDLGCSPHATSSYCYSTRETEPNASGTWDFQGESAVQSMIQRNSEPMQVQDSKRAGTSQEMVQVSSAGSVSQDQSLPEQDADLSTLATAGVTLTGSTCAVPELASPYQDLQIPLPVPAGSPPQMDPSRASSIMPRLTPHSNSNSNSNTGSSYSHLLAPHDGGQVVERTSINSSVQVQPRLSLRLGSLDQMVTDHLFAQHGLGLPEVSHQRSGQQFSTSASQDGEASSSGFACGWQVMGRPSWRKSLTSGQDSWHPADARPQLRRVQSEDLQSPNRNAWRAPTAHSVQTQSSSKSYKLGAHHDEDDAGAGAGCLFGVVPPSPSNGAMGSWAEPFQRQQQQQEQLEQDQQQELGQQEVRRTLEQAPPAMQPMAENSSMKSSKKKGSFCRSGTGASLTSEGRGESKIGLRRQKTNATLCSGMDALRTEHEAQLVATQAFSTEWVHHLSSSSEFHAKLPVLLLRLVGVIPISAGFIGKMQSLTVMLFFAISAIYTLHQGISRDQGAVYNHVSSALVAVSVVCGIGALRLGLIQDLLGPNRNPLEQYARQCGFQKSWNTLFFRRLMVIVVIWFVAISVKVYEAAAHNSRPVFTLFFSANPLILVVDISANTMLFFLIFCHLHVCAGLETCVDQYCLRLFDSADLAKGIIEWNILQALLRRAASTIEVCFVFVGTAMLALLLLTGIELYNLRDQSYGEQVLASWPCLAIWASNVVCPTILTFVAVFSSAQITEKCNRVPSLINSWCLSESVMDHSKQYIVQFINQSAAGFYVKGVRLNAVWAMKISYLVGVLMVTTISQSVLSPDVDK